VGERLVGALLLEKSGAAGMLHGPVVIASDDAPTAGGASTPPAADAPAAEASTGAEAIEVAAHLLSDALEHAGARGIDTLFTRPQGLDPVWVRLGFIPVPEVELPKALRGRPGVGLFGWRGGSALWSSSGRNAVPAASRSRR